MTIRRAAAAAAVAALLLGCGGRPDPAEPSSPSTPVPAATTASLCAAAHEFFVANAQLEETPADAGDDPEIAARWDRQTAALDELLQWAPGALESGLVRLRDASAAHDLSAYDAVVVEEAGVLQELEVLCPLPAG